MDEPSQPDSVTIGAVRATLPAPFPSSQPLDLRLRSLRARQLPLVRSRPLILGCLKQRSGTPPQARFGPHLWSDQIQLNFWLRIRSHIWWRARAIS